MLGSDTYRMGSRILCRKSTSGIPSTAVAAWEESDGHYYLLKATDTNSLSFQQAANGLIYQAGMSSAFWEIGNNAICKVKTWTEGMESESSTLAFVASRFPHIPLPKVIYSWVDEQQGRTFLILRRVEGQTLARAWQSLTSEQRSHVAATVAQYCCDLAEVTSEHLQSATGCGVLEPFLTVDAKPSHPSWKPQPLGPLPRSATERYFQRLSTQSVPTIGDKFYFYHADLSPTNILISDDGTVTAILDWESAAFYPKFWISLKPYRSGGFNLDAPDDSRYDWTDLLESNLANVGFTLDHDHVGWQKTLDFTFFELDEFHDDISLQPKRCKSFSSWYNLHSLIMKRIFRDKRRILVRISPGWQKRVYEIAPVQECLSSAGQWCTAEFAPLRAGGVIIVALVAFLEIDGQGGAIVEGL